MTAKERADGGGGAGSAGRDLMTATPDGPPSVPEIVSRYLAGESMWVLAKECNKSRRTLYRWMLSELGGDDYREVVTECLVNRVADADQELDDARKSKDPVRVSAAREACRFARMDLERRRPALYGPKQEVRHSGMAPTLNIVLLDKPSDSVGQVIEAEPAQEGP